MTSRLLALIAMFWLTAPAHAEMVGEPVAADLDGDAGAERFFLTDSGNGSVNLHIELASGSTIVVESIAWKGGIGQTPELELAPNGSVRLSSMNEAIGRDRWRMTLTIAFRDGAYRVAGFTFSWYDSLDPEGNGICDLNLLTGRGLLSKNGGPDRPIRTGWTALPVTEWNENISPPEVCEAF